MMFVLITTLSLTALLCYRRLNQPFNSPKVVNSHLNKPTPRGINLANDNAMGDPADIIPPIVGLDKNITESNSCENLKNPTKTPKVRDREFVSDTIKDIDLPQGVRFESKYLEYLTNMFDNDEELREQFISKLQSVPDKQYRKQVAYDLILKESRKLGEAAFSLYKKLLNQFHDPLTEFIKKNSNNNSSFPDELNELINDFDWGLGRQPQWISDEIGAMTNSIKLNELLLNIANKIRTRLTDNLAGAQHEDFYHNYVSTLTTTNTYTSYITEFINISKTPFISSSLHAFEPEHRNIDLTDSYKDMHGIMRINQDMRSEFISATKRYTRELEMNIQEANREKDEKFTNYLAHVANSNLGLQQQDAPATDPAANIPDLSGYKAKTDDQTSKADAAIEQRATLKAGAKESIAIAKAKLAAMKLKKKKSKETHALKTKIGDSENTPPNEEVPRILQTR
tara:strand:- start:12032 stop:13393 length:1362 start_codon:yes stop_codon:yes gene_type:complete